MGFKFNPFTGNFDEVNDASGSSPLTTKGDLYGYSTTDDRLEVGTDGQVLVADSSEPLGLKYVDAGDPTKTTYLKDVKSAGTGGGTATSGSWQTRDLNNQTGDTSFCSLSSNQFTLDAGKYEIFAQAPAYKVDTHIAKLYNITDAVDVIIGNNSFTTAADSVCTLCTIVGTITLSATKTFEIQHQVATTAASFGYGLNGNLGVDNVFTQVVITKIPENGGAVIGSPNTYAYLDDTVTAAISGFSSGNYNALGAGVTLTEGVWRVTGILSINLGTGSGTGFIALSGFFEADGTGSATPPTAISSSYDGDNTWSSINNSFALLLSVGIQNRVSSAPNEIFVTVPSSGTQDIYLVPVLDINVAGTGTITTRLYAVRIQ